MDTWADVCYLPEDDTRKVAYIEKARIDIGGEIAKQNTAENLIATLVAQLANHPTLTWILMGQQRGKVVEFVILGGHHDNDNAT